MVEVRMPLFDRLVDLDPGSEREGRPLRTLDREGLRESVRRELERLLNTRTAVPIKRVEERERTVIDYGIPDFSGFAAANPDDQRRLEGIIARAIEAFEPRLREVRVALEPGTGDKQRLRGVIEAMLVVEEVTEPLSFRTVFHSDGVEVRGHANQ